MGDLHGIITMSATRGKDGDSMLSFVSAMVGRRLFGSYSRPVALKNGKIENFEHKKKDL